jgi:hypothetical protein
MKSKVLLFSGLLLSGLIVAACKPKEQAQSESEILEETSPVIENENIILEGTDKGMPGEAELYATSTPEPTATPVVEEPAQ